MEEGSLTHNNYMITEVENNRFIILAFDKNISHEKRMKKKNGTNKANRIKETDIIHIIR